MTTIIRFPDPLHALILRWRTLGEEVGRHIPGRIPPELMAEWEDIERRMIGLRPATPEGAEAAVEMLADWVACHCDDVLTRSLAASVRHPE
jgi:hypothetical protein